ncbi:MAG: hypothetical protein F4X54_07570 [Chloroflexi bacterium]|nr:hypothetical protein [Chloroflexota bacterium]
MVEQTQQTAVPQQQPQQPIPAPTAQDLRTISLEAAGLINRPREEDRRQGVIDPQELLRWLEEAAWLRARISGREAALAAVVLSRQRAIHKGIVKPEDDIAIMLQASAGINGVGVKTYIEALAALNSGASIKQDDNQGGGGGTPWYKFW